RTLEALLSHAVGKLLGRNLTQRLNRVAVMRRGRRGAADRLDFGLCGALPFRLALATRHEENHGEDQQTFEEEPHARAPRLIRFKRRWAPRLPQRSPFFWKSPLGQHARKDLSQR